MQCSFCESKEVVLSAGYRYCRNCLWRVDEPIIHSCLCNSFPIPLSQIKALCHEMFGMIHYNLSNLPAIYKYEERGKWIESEKRFDIPQEIYIRMAFRAFLKSNHPIRYKEMKLDQLRNI